MQCYLLENLAPTHLFLPRISHFPLRRHNPHWQSDPAATYKLVTSTNHSPIFYFSANHELCLGTASCVRDSTQQYIHSTQYKDDKSFVPVIFRGIITQILFNSSKVLKLFFRIVHIGDSVSPMSPKPHENHKIKNYIPH